MSRTMSSTVSAEPRASRAIFGIDGKIGNNGNAKLTANGNTASSAYTHGPIKTTGEEYSYEVKSPVHRQ